MGIRDTWATPLDLWTFVHQQWKPTLDVCASAENTKCPVFFTAEQDAFTRVWDAPNNVCWCNPPSSEVARWIKECWEQAFRDPNQTVVCLVQAGVGSKWFQEYHQYATTYLLSPRPQFIPPKGIKASSNARDYMLMVFSMEATGNIWACEWK